MVIPWTATAVLVTEARWMAKKSRNRQRFNGLTVIAPPPGIHTNPTDYDRLKHKYIQCGGEGVRQFFDHFENAHRSNLQKDGGSAVKVHVEAALIGVVYARDKRSRQVRKLFMEVHMAVQFDVIPLLDPICSSRRAQ